MKHVYLFFLLFILVVTGKAQKAAGFEDLTLEKESFWNGSDGSGSFKSSNLTFKNSYNTEYKYWSGFSFSNVTDVTTKGSTNQYSAITGSGYNSSANYAVAYVFGSSSVEFDEIQTIRGLYITNSTYAYFSIKDGDDFTEKFGGATGTDPDYFKVIIEGIDASGEVTDTVDFYLADYRFEDSSSDYIVNDWTWLDLSSLGKVKSINFKLESSDVGDWGMNTPAYFCVDDVNGFGPVQLNEVTFASFDDVVNTDETYYNGNDLSGGFYSGNFYFKNYYDEEYFYWSGFAASNVSDKETAGYENQYSAITGGGVDGSSAYAVGFTGFGDSEILLKKSEISGFYVSNDTYAFLSMKNGDDYSKKFGGSNGTDPDWFKLTVEGFDDTVSKGQVDFYLADFRSDNSSEDYIVNDWQWVDLSQLGEVTSLKFSLSSSDTGQWGMNTPAYFVMDNLNKQIPSNVSPSLDEIAAEVYPNPFNNVLNIRLKNNATEVALFDVTGKQVRKMNIFGSSVSITDLDDLHSGIYLLKISDGIQSVTKKIMKR